MRPNPIAVVLGVLAATAPGTAVATTMPPPSGAGSPGARVMPAATEPPPPISCATPLVRGDPLDAGNDLHLGPAPDHFQPGADDDGQTYVFGEAGDDCLVGSGGYDWLDGGPGDDRLVGGPRSDRLVGGSGNDSLLTGDELGGPALSALETIRGGRGDDTAWPGPGSTAIVLGPGDDRVIGTDGSAGTIDCGPGDDTVVADADDQTIACEQVRRRPPLRIRVRPRDGGATLRLRAPWGVRRGGDLIGWSAAVAGPRRPGCGGLRTTDVSHGRRVTLRLRPARGTVACPGRWRVQVEAVFADDPQAECDGGDCGTATAAVGPRVAFVLGRLRHR